MTKKPVYTETARSCDICGALTPLNRLRGPRHNQLCPDCLRKQSRETLVWEELPWTAEDVPPERAR